MLPWQAISGSFRLARKDCNRKCIHWVGCISLFLGVILFNQGGKPSIPFYSYPNYFTKTLADTYNENQNICKIQEDHRTWHKHPKLMNPHLQKDNWQTKSTKKPWNLQEVSEASSHIKPAIWVSNIFFVFTLTIPYHPESKFFHIQELIHPPASELIRSQAWSKPQPSGASKIYKTASKIASEKKWGSTFSPPKKVKL